MRVRMVNSVDEYVAGQEYDLDDETSDRFVVLGYAEGDLSREVSDGERDSLRNGHQEVSLG